MLDSAKRWIVIYPYQEANPDYMHQSISCDTLKVGTRLCKATFYPVPLLFTATAFALAAFIGCHHRITSNPPASTIITSGIPPITDSLKLQMDHYQIREFTTPVDWAPDGNGIIVLGRTGETSQLYGVAAPGGSLQPLTFLNESIISASVCPDTTRDMLLFTHDSGGNENFRICALRFGTRDTIRLTSDSAQNDGAIWSNRGDRFAYTSNRRNGRDFDIYIASIGTYSIPQCIISAGGNWEVYDWSPDDRQLLVGKYGSRTSSLLFTFDLSKNLLAPLTDTSDTVSQEIACWVWGAVGCFTQVINRPISAAFITSIVTHAATRF